MAFNLRDPILKDVRVRQALACAINRQPMIEYLWRGFGEAGQQHPADAKLGVLRRQAAVFL